MSQYDDTPCLDRRAFLRLSGAGLAVAACGGALSACGDDLDNLSGTLEVPLADHPELTSEGQTALIDAGLRSPIAITRTSDEVFVVTGTECSHQNCTVGRNGDGWRCPCHGATFKLSGAKVSGPARVGLTRYDFSLEGEVLTIIGE